jgi:hypothetical protein
MTMDYRDILRGDQGYSQKILESIALCLEDIDRFPYLLEEIYKEAITLEEPSLDALRFALVRLQVYADIHRNENMEEAQNLKYVGQVLEKIIFGTLMLEREEPQD